MLQYLSGEPPYVNVTVLNGEPSSVNVTLHSGEPAYVSDVIARRFEKVKNGHIFC